MSDWEKARKQIAEGNFPRISEADDLFEDQGFFLSFDSGEEEPKPEDPKLAETRRQIKARCIELGLSRSEAEDLIFCQFGTNLEKLTGLDLLNCLSWVKLLETK
jgi:hypothetical protein